MFYVNEDELNDYERGNEKLSFRNLLKCLNIYDCLLLCNNAYNFISELVNGSEEDEDGNYEEVYQYFLFDCNNWDLERIKKTDLLVYYSSALELYILGVKHYGTAWDYVLTNETYTTDFDKYLNQ